MFPTRKEIRNKVREFPLSSHLPHRSSHKSVPMRGVARQPQNVEVHFYG